MARPLRILGVDPGSRATGWGVIARSGSRLTVVARGVIRCTGSDLPPRLALLSREIEAVVEQHTVDAAALETPFHGVNSRSLIVLAQARGALVSALARRDLEIAEVTPATVKQALTGNGRADKQQVARMVRLILGISPEERIAADTTDALAVAICYAQRLRLDRLETLRPNTRQNAGRER